jgi:signal transduction histidine kinase
LSESAVSNRCRRELDCARREDCLRPVEEAIGNVRQMAQLLRAIIRTIFGLAVGLHWLVESFRRAHRHPGDYRIQVLQPPSR